MVVIFRNYNGTTVMLDKCWYSNADLNYSQTVQVVQVLEFILTKNGHRLFGHQNG